MKKKISLVIGTASVIVAIYAILYLILKKHYSNPFSPLYSETLSGFFAPASEVDRIFNFRKRVMELFEGDWQLARGTDATTAHALIDGDTITFQRCSGYFDSWEGQEYEITTNSRQDRVWIVHRGEEIELHILALAQGERLHLLAMSEADPSWKEYSERERELMWSSMTDEFAFDRHYLFAPMTTSNGDNFN